MARTRTTYQKGKPGGPGRPKGVLSVPELLANMRRVLRTGSENMEATTALTACRTWFADDEVGFMRELHRLEMQYKEKLLANESSKGVESGGVDVGSEKATVLVEKMLLGLEVGGEEGE